MNTDIAALCRVLTCIVKSAKKGKLSGPDYSMCIELLGELEKKYRAGAAALDAAALTLQEE